MPLHFQRPVGAQADVKELEYIAALHQTCMPQVRENATISSLDVIRFLRSRCYLQVSHQDGIRIVRSLGGGLVSADVIQTILQANATIRNAEDKPKSKAKFSWATSLKKRIMGKSKKKKNEEKIASEDRHVELDSAKQDQDSNAEVSESHEELDADKVESGRGRSFDDSQVSQDEEADDDGYKEEYLDLVQIMAILLMPTLARAANEWKDERQHVDQQQDDVDPAASGITPNTYVEELEHTAEMIDTHKSGTSVSAKEEKSSLHPRPRLIGHVLATMLAHVGASKNDEPPVVNAELVRKLLMCGGELERAADAVLVDKMVQAASSCTGRLDEEAFVNALTTDLSQWKVGSEDELTTTFYDVWGYQNSRDRKKAQVETVDENDEHAQSSGGHDEQKDNAELDNRPKNMLDIDFAIDAHSSIFVTVIIFLFFICTAVVYATLIRALPQFRPKCDQSFDCELVTKLVTWIIYAAILSACGFIIIVPLSIGNNPTERSPVRLFIAFIIALAETLIPYYGVNLYQQSENAAYDKVNNVANHPRYNEAQLVTLVIGFICSGALFIQMIVALVGDARIHKSKFLKKWFTIYNIRKSAQTKKAATRKINSVLQHASELHMDDLSTAGREEVMVNLALNGQHLESCGGFWWSWKMFFTGALFEHEGVWITSRLIIIQVSHIVMIIFWSVAVKAFIETSIQKAQDWQDDLQEDLPQWVYDFVPTPQQVKIATYPAYAVMVLMMVLLSSIYFPSYVGTVLKYRSGVNPSLRSPTFKKYRVAADVVYTNIGNALYGMIGAAFLFFFLFGLVIFLFIWTATRSFMLVVLAWALGLGITVTAKIIMTRGCRRVLYTGYYRTHPVTANLTGLALECWFIGLGGGTLVSRLCEFLLAAAFFVGRTDVPFLNEEVTLFGYLFDYVPINFTKEILGHDAHRHPYMERLYAMYMMKLKHEDFCSDAGACWRQLFVVTLMPWMLKLRVFSDKRLKDATEAYNARRKEREVQTGLVEEGVDDVGLGLKAMLGVYDESGHVEGY